MGTVYLIPSLLSEEGIDGIPPAVLSAVKNCQVFFVENERTTRRYFKKIWKEMVIDEYEWFNMSDAFTVSDIFKQYLRNNKTIGIISEAGCPGVADPGQALIAIAQEMGATVKPLTGPSSILLALMASGMNGQHFQFAGYLPVDERERATAIRELEAESAKKNCTQIVIETPYRNNKLAEAFIRHCKPSTRLCIAANITDKNEMIQTKTIAGWKDKLPDLHKQPVIFCFHAMAGPLT